MSVELEMIDLVICLLISSFNFFVFNFVKFDFNCMWGEGDGMVFGIGKG